MTSTVFAGLLSVFPLVLVPALEQARTVGYEKMAPLEQYLIADRNAEIALARSAAPPSISKHVGPRPRGFQNSGSSKALDHERSTKQTKSGDGRSRHLRLRPGRHPVCRAAATLQPLS